MFVGPLCLGYLKYFFYCVWAFKKDPYVGEKFLFLGFKKGFELQRFLNLKLITIINKKLDCNNKVIELHVYIGLCIV